MSTISMMTTSWIYSTSEVIFTISLNSLCGPKSIALKEERMYTSQKHADRGMILNRNRMNIDPMRSRTKGKPRRRRYRETKR
jgi:hypothetical protein